MGLCSTCGQNSLVLSLNTLQNRIIVTQENEDYVSLTCFIQMGWTQCFSKGALRTPVSETVGTVVQKSHFWALFRFQIRISDNSTRK